MKNITNEQISRYRQSVARLIERLKELSLKAAYKDTLFHGTPLEFYKCCGRKGCHCAKGGEHRHGPYRAIQIWVDGRQRQVGLRKDEGHYHEMAQHYQYQQQNRSDVVKTMDDLLQLLDEMLEARTICSKE